MQFIKINLDLSPRPIKQKPQLVNEICSVKYLSHNQEEEASVIDTLHDTLIKTSTSTLPFKENKDFFFFYKLNSTTLLCLRATDVRFARPYALILQVLCMILCHFDANLMTVQNIYIINLRVLTRKIQWLKIKYLSTLKRSNKILTY